MPTSEAHLFKHGSGSGTDLSTIRSTREKLSGGGKPSGPLSFMRIYDQVAAVVKSGGKTRRAAKMQSLSISHPDILEFIDCKYREDEKAKLLIQSGLAPADAYGSVLFQSSNLSVRLDDDFLEAVERDANWYTTWVTNPQMFEPVGKAADIFSKIAETAWSCGDPGVQFDTTINQRSPLDRSSAAARIGVTAPVGRFH